MRKVIALALTLALTSSPVLAAMQQVGGPGLYYPAPFLPAGLFAAPSATNNAMSGANTAAEISFVGRLKGATSFTGTKNIQSIEFLAGAITTASSSIVVDIEGVSTSAGNPSQPDGSVCGPTGAGTGGATVTVALTSLTASAWNNAAAVGNFGSVCQIHEGDQISVNFKWSGTPGGTASLAIQGASIGSAGTLPGTVTTTNGSTWTAATQLPDIVINFSDSTVGTIDGGYVSSAFGTATSSYGSGSSPNEYGNQFTPAFAGVINGVWFAMENGSASDQLTVEITNSSGSVIGSASATMDGHNFLNTGSSNRLYMFPLPETTLTAGTTYYMGLRASAATAGLNASYNTVASASHLGLNSGGTAVQYSTRAGSSWAAATNTRQVLMGVRFSQLSDGAGGGGGNSGIIGGNASLEERFRAPDLNLPPDEWLAQLAAFHSPSPLPRLR